MNTLPVSTSRCNRENTLLNPGRSRAHFLGSQIEAAPRVDCLSADDRSKFYLEEERNPTMAKKTKSASKPSSIKPLSKRKAWADLKAHHARIRNAHLRELFAENPKRGEQYLYRSTWHIF